MLVTPAASAADPVIEAPAGSSWYLALGDVYAGAGIPVADVETAFAIGDWETLVPMAGHGEVPLNAALLCLRTWQCHAPPLGPDRHPNVLGFRAMAEAFARELGLEPASVEFGGDRG